MNAICAWIHDVLFLLLHSDTDASTAGDEAINYLAPEVFTQATYETKRYGPSYQNSTLR